MGYDLSFWAYADESVSRTPEDHLHTYTLLSEGEKPDGLVALNSEDVRARLPEVLHGWTPENGNFESSRGAIQVTLGPYHARFDLYGKWSGDDANALIDLMMGFGCPLYDSQKNERFVLG